MNRNVVTLFCALVLLVTGCGSEQVIDTEQQVIDIEQLVERDGAVYEIDSEVGFTGRAVGSYENGQKKGEVNLKDGKLDGKFLEWYENGQKRTEANFKDGKLDGKRTVWYMNGQKDIESTYKDGKEIESTTWDENGREK